MNTLIRPQKWGDFVTLNRLLCVRRTLQSIRMYMYRSLISGAMWFTHQNGRSTDIRHTCEHGDHLQRYGWIRHDGTTFGQQEIVDNGLSVCVCVCVSVCVCKCMCMFCVHIAYVCVVCAYVYVCERVCL